MAPVYMEHTDVLVVVRFIVSLVTRRDFIMSAKKQHHCKRWHCVVSVESKLCTHSGAVVMVMLHSCVTFVISYTTPCLQKNKQNYFCYNFVILPPNLTIFGTKMAICLKLCELHSFSTSPNSRQCTTV